MTDFIFLGSKITADDDFSHEIKRNTCPLEENFDKPRERIKKQRHYFDDKGPYSQAMVFPAVMYGCESWTIKKAEGQRIDAFELFEKTFEIPLDNKEIRTVNHKGNQPCTFIGRTDAEAETPIFWPPDEKT